jgi:hypothetical protein
MKKEIQVFCEKIVVIFNNTEYNPVYFLRYEQKPVCTNWPKHEKNLITSNFFFLISMKKYCMNTNFWYCLDTICHRMYINLMEYSVKTIPVIHKKFTIYYLTYFTFSCPVPSLPSCSQGFGPITGHVSGCLLLSKLLPIRPNKGNMKLT